MVCGTDPAAVLPRESFIDVMNSRQTRGVWRPQAKESLDSATLVFERNHVLVRSTNLVNADLVDDVVPLLCHAIECGLR